MARDDIKILEERSRKISNIQLRDSFCKYRVISYFNNKNNAGNVCFKIINLKVVYGIVWDGVSANMSITDGANLEDMGLGHILTMIALFFPTPKKSGAFY